MLPNSVLAISRLRISLTLTRSNSTRRKSSESQEGRCASQEDEWNDDGSGLPRMIFDPPRDCPSNDDYIHVLELFDSLLQGIMSFHGRRANGARNVNSGGVESIIADVDVVHALDGRKLIGREYGLVLVLLWL